MNETQLAELVEQMKAIDCRLGRIESAISGDESHDILGYRQRVRKCEVWRHVMDSEILPAINKRIDRIYYTAAGIGATVSFVGVYIWQLVLKTIFG